MYTLGASLTPIGITLTAYEERATKAEKLLQSLRENCTLSPDMLPQRARYIFSTFVQSRYTFCAPPHSPIRRFPQQRPFLTEANVCSVITHQNTSDKLKLLNGIFRIDSIQLVREQQTHKFSNKVIQRCKSDDQLTNAFVNVE